MDKKWFVLINGQVSGPFTEPEVDGKATEPQVLIWGRGYPEWMDKAKWKKSLANPETVLGLNGDAGPVSAANRIWKIRVSGSEVKPMNQAEMMDFLRTHNDHVEIQLWTEGYTDWKDIYQIHAIMDEMGISRRKHPRVPIMGTLACEGAGTGFIARVLSISEGGLGITETGAIKIGEKFKGVLKSPNLKNLITCNFEVIYMGADGYAGIKFVGLDSESKVMVIDYIKKFSQVKS
jgi:hypothetical protein